MHILALFLLSRTLALWLILLTLALCLLCMHTLAIFLHLSMHALALFLLSPTLAIFLLSLVACHFSTCCSPSIRSPCLLFSIHTRRVAYFVPRSLRRSGAAPPRELEDRCEALLREATDKLALQGHDPYAPDLVDAAAFHIALSALIDQYSLDMCCDVVVC